MTKELGDDLKDIAATRTDDGPKSESDVLDMAAAATEEEYSETHIEKLRTRAAVDTAKVQVSGGLRQFIWRVMRPVLDSMAHKQNDVNAQVVHAMEMEKRERDRQIGQLKKELDELKRKG